MTIDEAARELARMYHQGIAAREQALSVHLFGIKFAAELDGMPLKELAIRAEIPVTYATEIRKRMNLARYVEIRKTILAETFTASLARLATTTRARQPASGLSLPSRTSICSHM